MVQLDSCNAYNFTNSNRFIRQPENIYYLNSIRQPENIYYLNSDKGFVVYLGDFGLACSPYNRNHSAIGTPMYAALEQYRGKCTPKVSK